MFTAPKLVKYHALFAKEIEYIGAYRGKMGGSNLRISRNTQFNSSFGLEASIWAPFFWFVMSWFFGQRSSDWYGGGGGGICSEVEPELMPPIVDWVV